MRTRSDSFRTPALRWIVLTSAVQGVLGALVTWLNVPEAARTAGIFLITASWAHFFTLAALISLPWLVLLGTRRLLVLFLIVTTCAQALLLLAMVVDAKVFFLCRKHLNGVALTTLSRGPVGDHLVFAAHMWKQVSTYASAVAAAAMVLCCVAWNASHGRCAAVGARAICLVAPVIMVWTQSIAMIASARGDHDVMGAITRIAWSQPISSSTLMRPSGRRPESCGGDRRASMTDITRKNP